MNCPSRTDDTILHCEWNQNPPFLAPDLTTRQDLNGISNTREHRRGIGLMGLCDTYPDDRGLSPVKQLEFEKHRSLSLGGSLTMSGPPKRVKLNFINQKHISTLLSLAYRLSNGLLWVASVLFVAILITNTSLNRYLSIGQWSAPNLSDVDVVMSPQPIGDSNQASIVRRHVKRQTCAQGGVNGDVYNTSLHVGALFIILAVSYLACAFPVLAIWFPRLRIPSSFLFFVTHFGTGVLIATAFVHLLPTAFTLLGDPCLSDFWTTDYPAMPGAISLAGIFLVTLIEMVFSPARHFSSDGDNKDDQEQQVAEPDLQAPLSTLIVNASGYPNAPTIVNDSSQNSIRNPQLRTKGPLLGRSSSFSRAIYRIGEDSDRICRIASAPESNYSPRNIEIQAPYDSGAEVSEKCSVSDKQKRNKAVMQVIMLEVGILFHSVFIGMSLSVSVGNEFLILLIAIIFHQTFEGLALGSRIAALDWPDKAIQPWLMCLAYGCTTPIGQAIGIATHTLYSPDSEVGLLLVGTMNAISAGLLIFASLVELMSEDFLSDESWRVLRGRKRVIACLLVFLGAFCMSLVGAWA